MIFKARDKYFDLSQKPLIMGILNITPDSFSDGGKFFTYDKALAHCEKLVREGADIIDIGGESSRPGSLPVSDDEELDRILQTLRTLRSRFDICLSIDTYKPAVAEAVLAEGADMINDIFGTDSDEKLMKVIAYHSAGLCIMHIKGTPADMQNKTEYTDIVSEVKAKLTSSVSDAVKCGVGIESIVIDPGIGFGKELEGNIRILHDLDLFKEINRPVLIGTSRKSFIGKILPAEPGERLIGTISSNVIALSKGASIFRVHDVKENKQAIDIAFEILKS
jgi:dihydropteroate synthase